AFSLIGLSDVALTFFTGIEENGEIVRDRKVIADRYLRSGFWVDLLANLPYALFVGSSPDLRWLLLLPLLRLNKLVRITGRWQALQVLQTSMLRILRYGLAIVLVANGGACLWLWIGLRELGPNGWIQRLNLLRDHFDTLYLHSLYWTVTTLATVGYGDITPKTSDEMIVAILMMFTGVSLYAFAVGNVVSIISDLDQGRLAHSNRQSAIADYLRCYGVDPDIVRRVRRFNDYQWSRNRGVEPMRMFEDLPRELHSEVMLAILRDSVCHVPLFTAATPALRKRLALLLQPISYPPGTVVLETNVVGDEIVFITRGEVRIETDQPLPERLLTVTAGDYIGDLSFYLREPRCCRALASTYVDAFLLSREVFESLEKREPQLPEALHAMAEQQSERNQALLLAGLVV
ncbi:MAG: ion transporter, partial [Cyanobium sp.]